MNDKIYLPITCGCADIINNSTIRCYTTRPSRPSSSSGGYYSYAYYDFYYTSHYTYITGTTNFYYNSTLPSCSLNSRLTNDLYFRYDLSDILIIFAIISIVVVVLPILLFKKLTKRRY